MINLSIQEVIIQHHDAWRALVHKIRDRMGFADSSKDSVSFIVDNCTFELEDDEVHALINPGWEEPEVHAWKNNEWVLLF